MNPHDRQPNQHSLSQQPTTPPAAAPGQTPARPVPASGDTAHTQSGRDTLGGAPSGIAPGAALDIERKVFAERFDLLEELGSGGMGRVLKAFDRKLQRPVAVKRIKGPLATDPDLLRRFLREAQFAARLNHPNVVTVHDILTDDEGPYLVLEFIDGESLAQRLQRGAIPWREAIDLLLPICDAVTAAHAQGIIHRDIKPANILLPKKGQPKLSDFGIAKSLDGVDLTQTKAAMGTLAYGAPEQFQSARTADARSDVYGLAATLYHMVTGEIPQPISADELPVEVRSEVLRGLQRSPDKRHISVLEFAKALADIWKGISASAKSGLNAPVERTPTSVPPELDGLGDEPRPAQPAVAKIISPSPNLGDTKEITLPDGVKHKLIWCPPGTFTMGTPGATNDERPVNVTLTSGFWLGQTVVTQAIWTAVMETTPWIEHGDKSYYKTGPNYPAMYVGHTDARFFCDRLTNRERAASRLSSGWKYALPTEAQWEYACRAGTTTVYSFGDDEGRLGQYAWFDKYASDIGEKYAHAVGAKKPNPWGLFDMHGNVWEWCREWSSDKLVGGTNPSGSTTGSNRVNRGGSWDYSAGSCRSAYRFGNDPSYRNCRLGFRLCLSSN